MNTLIEFLYSAVMLFVHLGLGLVGLALLVYTIREPKTDAAVMRGGLLALMLMLAQIAVLAVLQEPLGMEHPYRVAIPVFAGALVLYFPLALWRLWRKPAKEARPQYDEEDADR